jgi:formamidopyrimidine-DNA glycosylase
MPELPEVETVRAGLAASVTGARVSKVIVHDVRSIRRHQGSPANFIETLTGQTFDSVVRRGKFLWLPIKGSDLCLIGHLGMSGQMLLRTPGFEADKLNRVTIELETKDGPLEFRFVDQRIFGSLALDPMVETIDGGAGGFGSSVKLIPTQAAHISRDPLDPQFDEARVLAIFKKKNSGIKRVLLDQGVLSGIGNIYADEALNAACIHPERPAGRLTRVQCDRLAETVRTALEDGIRAQGSSIRDFRSPDGGYGSMQERVSDAIRLFRDLPDRNVYMSAKLEKSQDEMGRVMYAPSAPGSKISQSLPYFFDEVLALRLEKDADGIPQRALMCESDGLWQAKDRSGKLEPWEAPDLGAIISKIAGRA